jgi:nitric oxide reductase NorE protein
LLFRAGQEHLSVLRGAVSTLLLLTSSLLVAQAMRDREQATTRARQRLLGAAVGCGLLFAALKLWDYADKASQGLTPASGDFFLFYWLLTGLHLVHLMLGLGALGALSRLLDRPQASATHRSYEQGCAAYWHLVDALWVVLFALLFLMR